MDKTVFIIIMFTEPLGSFETSARIYQLARRKLTEELNIQNSYLLEQAARMTH